MNRGSASFADNRYPRDSEIPAFETCGSCGACFLFSKPELVFFLLDNQHDIRKPHVKA